MCTETLVEGDEVQLLPCKHAYHEACVAPWLKQNNSCPVCRQVRACVPVYDYYYCVCSMLPGSPTVQRD